MHAKYLKLLQQRTGQLAIGRSTLRNQGAPGVVDCARQYVKNMNLSPIAKIKTNDQFRAFLQRHTKMLCKSFPGGAKNNWGAARKSLNIFLRDCLYNHYLNKEYKFTNIEKWLEVPLDKDVGMKLYGEYAGDLPRWQTIKTLDLGTSDLY